MSARSVDAVIWDFAGVLTMPVMSRLEELSTAAGFPPDAIRHAMMGDYGGDGSAHPWHRLERGELTLEEYGELVAHVFDDMGMPGFEKHIGRGFSAAGINEPMLDLVRRVRAAGVKTAICTNNIAEFRSHWKQSVDADNLVDMVFDSSEIGMRKPEARIYRHVTDALGVVPGRAAFLDDLHANVDGAKSVGLIGIYVDIDSEPAIARVQELAGLS